MVNPSSFSGGSSRIGWRGSPRRPIVVSCLSVVLAMAVSAGAIAGGPPQVTVHEKDAVYQVVATFQIAQSAAVAATVLTDYERIPQFMPDVLTSRIVKRSIERTLVEQEAVAKVLMFSKRIYLLLEVEERPGTITFRDLCGKSFARYAGSWRIVEHDGQPTAVVYELSAQPAFAVPEFLLKQLLKRDATRMIERLQAEMAARSR